jgi:hypothetical protein
MSSLLASGIHALDLDLTNPRAQPTIQGPTTQSFYLSRLDSRNYV